MTKTQTGEKNNEAKRSQSKRRNCLRKCFHLFKCIIDHANIRFLSDFFTNLLPSVKDVYSLSVLIAASFQLRSLRSSQKFIAIHFFHLDIQILQKSHTKKNVS